MFKNIFSEKGRIGRIEFFVSFLLFLIVFFGSIFILALIEFPKKIEWLIYLIFLFLNIFNIIFFNTQAIKRAHDLNSNDWKSSSDMLYGYELILDLPFLLFSKSVNHNNRFNNIENEK